MIMLPASGNSATNGHARLGLVKLAGGPLHTGRPPKCTEELTERIAWHVRRGSYIEIACEMEGITRAKFFRWMRLARTIGGRYRKFRTALRQAQAEAEIRDVTRLDNFADVDPRVLQWRLQHRFPKRWGTTDRMIVAGDPGAPILHVHLAVPRGRRAEGSEVIEVTPPPGLEESTGV